MIQVARPFQTVSPGDWQPTDVHVKINQFCDSPDDSNHVEVDCPTDTEFEVSLPPLARPKPGTHKLTVRIGAFDTDPITATIILLEGDQVVARKSQSVSSGFANVALELTDNEIASISSFSNLRVRVHATCCTCSSMYSPMTIRGVVSNVTGNLIPPAELVATRGANTTSWLSETFGEPCTEMANGNWVALLCAEGEEWSAAWGCWGQASWIDNPMCDIVSVSGKYVTIRYYVEEIQPGTCSGSFDVTWNVCDEAT